MWAKPSALRLGSSCEPAGGHICGLGMQSLEICALNQTSIGQFGVREMLTSFFFHKNNKH